ncbi:MAG: GMC family oxidoreductase [Gemmobacter sp.]
MPGCHDPRCPPVARARRGGCRHRHGNAILSLIFLIKGVLIDEYRKILVGHRDRSKKALGYGWPLYRRHIGNVLRGIGPLTLFVGRWVRLRILPARKLPAAFLVARDGNYAIDLQFEQVPNPESRITLGAETDAHGVRRACIDWRPCEADRAGLARVIAAMQEASRPGVLEFDPADIDPATVELFPVPSHHIGTARMAASPRTGVCDANGEVFDTRGLYIAGAAAFPTSGFANPTLMIVALTLRLANHLATVTRRR